MAQEPIKHVTEGTRQIPVCCEAEVLVLGGGPAGHSAAVSAARSGAKTVLVERYGHFGGMATGGLVTMIHAISDGTPNRIITGNVQDWFDSLIKWNAIDVVDVNEIGKEGPDSRGLFGGMFFRSEGKLLYGARTDAEVLKATLNDMIVESGATIYMHTQATDPIMEGNAIKGVFIESKSGREAILADRVIDATGDGDIMARAGCSWTSTLGASNRIANPALCIEFANVDWAKNEAYKAANPDAYAALMQELAALDGFTMHFKTIVSRGDVCHFNMFLKGYDVTKKEDLTRIEVDVRRRMMVTYEFFKSRVPGFDECYIMTTAPQIGLRGSRIINAEFEVTEAVAVSGEKFEDTVCEFPPLRGNYPENPHVFIPYRSLLPKEVENLMVAGRMFCSDEVVNEHFNTISHCIAMGQAIGCAAAMSAKNGKSFRALDMAALREMLIKDGLSFPSFA